MKFGFCNLSLVPVRREATHTSEMVNQLMFGDHFEITEQDKEWAKIKNAYDNYPGWVNIKQFQPITEITFNRLNGIFPDLCGDFAQLIYITNNETTIPILLGSNLPYIQNSLFTIENIQYSFEGQKITITNTINKSNLVENALMYLNVPYLWGGRSPFGIDCSGYTQMIYKMNGVKLFRDANQQALQGETITFIEEAEPGDLIFFDNEAGDIVHVGIYLEKSKIIHASGKVRIDTIDHVGIFNNSLQKYTHNLRIIKKII